MASFWKKLLEEKDISINGYPGREFVMNAQGGIWQDRLYLVQDRIYLVFIFISNDLLSDNKLNNEQKAESKLFFESFQIKTP